ncbi:uncharacterized protein LOC122940446 [Bufo gargarizans]|uniref:uncharacterized protein LOC122940446 n=1 Tax=Bufo gargarizans TaxID=30331 RepID=UPI001CF56832|nr:uncharacterized protein LOC122940446 [Bufo gargarizans]
MPKWDVERLITLVQERPELWDTRTNVYLDRVKEEVASEKVARLMRCAEWEKADARGRAELVKKTKTRWNSCRDQFRRECNKRGWSGEGSSRKRAYIYSSQLQFLRPVMDLRPTVDNLEEPEDSDVGGEETAPVFSPEPSPTPTPAEESTQPAMATTVVTEGSPQTSPQRRPRTRRSARQQTSGLVTLEIIDARVIEFLAQRRS